MSKQCDFCDQKEIAKSYACPDFDIESIFLNLDKRETSSLVSHSIGHWGACTTCAALIDADKWDELRERSLTTCSVMKGTTGAEREALLEYIKVLHGEFRRLRLTVA